MIPFAQPRYWGNEKLYLNAAFDSTWISEGKFNNTLKFDFAREFESDKVLLTSNGTSALQLAFQSMGLGEGDHVIFPGFCFQAAANVALQLGIIPEFADVDLETWNISGKTLDYQMHDMIKAIVVVHNYGYPCDMPRIMAIANSDAISVIEDCAEAIFTKVNGQYVGTFGDFGTFSFHATKTFTTGEGGMLICKLPEDYQKAELIRSHGLAIRGSYDHQLAGNNFRMPNLQAAIGCAQFENKKKIVERKQEICIQYVQSLELQEGIILRKPPHRPEYVLWSFPIRLDLKYFNMSRDDIISKLKEKGIETRPGFVPASKLEYFNGTGKLPNSEILGDTVLVLPSFLSITEDEIVYVCKSLLDLRS